MAKNKRPIRNKGRTVTVFIVMEVRAANTNAAGTQQDHAGIQFGSKMSLDSYVLCAVQHSGFHIQAHWSSPRNSRKDSVMTQIPRPPRVEMLSQYVSGMG